MTGSDSLEALTKTLHSLLRERNWLLATAESCTGGWVAKLLTDQPGSSATFDRGFVTYSNAAKMEMLGVSPDTLDRYGAVSEETVREMAEGAVRNSHANLSLAISGIAGPGGGTPEKPVGTVCFAWCFRDGETHTETKLFAGDRDAVRRQSAQHALQVLVSLIQDHR